MSRRRSFTTITSLCRATTARGCALLKLSADGAEEVYFNRDMRNHYSSSVLLDGVLYGYSSRILTAMNFKTGEVLWKDRSVGKGKSSSPTASSTCIAKTAFWAWRGPAPEGYRELARHEIGRGDFRTWALPVVSGGKLIVRDQDTARAFDIRE